MADEIKFKIEADGKLSYTTDKVSPMNHKSADEVLRRTKTRMGGKHTEKSKGKHEHTHAQTKITQR